jgi:hypothetical protein
MRGHVCATARRSGRVKWAVPENWIATPLPIEQTSHALMQNQSVVADDGEFIRGRLDWASDH